MGDVTTSGGIKSMAARGCATASSSSNQVKGKRIVTTVQKRIKIMEAKRKRLNPYWKPQLEMF
jgi:hypothetical protein